MQDTGRPNGMDYTACYSYNRYGLEIDWEENQTTAEPVTDEPGDELTTWEEGNVNIPPGLVKYFIK